jgi:hypothetical protein
MVAASVDTTPQFPHCLNHPHLPVRTTPPRPPHKEILTLNLNLLDALITNLHELLQQCVIPHISNKSHQHAFIKRQQHGSLAPSGLLKNSEISQRGSV